MSRLPTAVLILLLVSISSSARAQQAAEWGAPVTATLPAHPAAAEPGLSPVRLPLPSSFPTRAELPVGDATSAPRPALDWNALQGSSGSPRWVKWGLVGAGAGALTFMALGQMTIDTQPNPPLQDAAFGAAAGFIIIGGSIALYDAICAPGSSSRRAGLCGR